MYKVEIQVLTFPAHLPLNSEDYSRIQSITIKAMSREPHTGAWALPEAGTYWHIEKKDFLSQCQSVRAATSLVRQSKPLCGH